MARMHKSHALAAPLLGEFGAVRFADFTESHDVSTKGDDLRDGCPNGPQPFRLGRFPWRSEPCVPPSNPKRSHQVQELIADLRGRQDAFTCCSAMFTP